jgi:hypothetical protein
MRAQVNQTVQVWYSTCTSTSNGLDWIGLDWIGFRGLRQFHAPCRSNHSSDGCGDGLFVFCSHRQNKLVVSFGDPEVELAAADFLRQTVRKSKGRIGRVHGDSSDAMQSCVILKWQYLTVKYLIAKPLSLRPFASSRNTARQAACDAERAGSFPFERRDLI